MFQNYNGCNLRIYLLLIVQRIKITINQFNIAKVIFNEFTQVFLLASIIHGDGIHTAVINFFTINADTVFNFVSDGAIHNDLYCTGII